MVIREKDQEFQMDHNDDDEAKEIYNLLRDLRITVIDEEFVPKEASYIYVHGFGYQNENGFNRSVSPGKQITLRQDAVSRLLVTGHIKPTDEDGWTPVKLLGPMLKEVVKKMFDLPEEEKENFAKNWAVRSGRR